MRFYQPALKRTAAPQSGALWRRIGTCNYVLCRFPQWEAAQQQRGLTTARTIELALRWDKKSDDSGRERQIVREYLQGQAKVAARQP